MKVIAFSTSPNRNNGNTAKILNPFLKGLKSQGANVELYFTRDMDIQLCRGCTGDCLFESDGTCLCNDDLTRLYPNMRQADIWVFATPNYVDMMPESFRTLLDRMEPLCPPIAFDDMETEEAYHDDGKVVFVSTSGLWEISNFDSIVENVKSFAQTYQREYSGGLLRPHSWAIGALQAMNYNVDDIFKAAFEAGSDLARTGKISDNFLNTVSRELLPKDSFFKDLTEYLEKSGK